MNNINLCHAARLLNILVLIYPNSSINLDE